jgi:hypothetical protein
VKPDEPVPRKGVAGMIDKMKNPLGFQKKGNPKPIDENVHAQQNPDDNREHLLQAEMQDSKRKNKKAKHMAIIEDAERKGEKP